MTTSDYRRSDVFLNLHFRLSQRTEIYDRSYQKIQAVAAELGGIIKFYLITGELVVYLFREVLYRDYILTFFSEEKTKRICNSISKGYFIYTSPNKKYIDSAIKDLSVNSIKGLVSIDSKKENVCKRKVKLNSMILLGPCLFDSKIRRNISLINSRFKRIEFLFDVIHYLKSKDEIRALKKIVFDDMQNKMLTQSYTFKLNAMEEEKQFECSIDDIKRKKVINNKM